MSQQAPSSTSVSARIGVPFVRRLKVRNYKSVGQADIELHPITVLVGRNGAGKSNLLDAIRFVADALDYSLDHAIRDRGGIDQVRRRSTGHPRNFAIAFELDLSGGRNAGYGFELAATEKGGFRVKSERLSIKDRYGRVVDSYTSVSGTVQSTASQYPPAQSDRLYLVAASSLPQFREVYESLRSMGFYNLNPQEMKELQSPDSGELLHRDGSNIASVIGRLRADQPEAMDRVEEFLGRITPGIKRVERVQVGPRETLEFSQEVSGATHPWRFYAANMSDGTLRALGVLVAVQQLARRASPIRLVGIEEPETALHPAAAGALMDSLQEAARHTQVVVTSHSPDLLDAGSLDPTCLLVVVSEQGETKVAPADIASREAIKQHLYTAGELHRLDQIQPDRESLRRQEQMDLWSENP